MRYERQGRGAQKNSVYAKKICTACEFQIRELLTAAREYARRKKGSPRCLPAYSSTNLGRSVTSRLPSAGAYDAGHRSPRAKLTNDHNQPQGYLLYGLLSQHVGHGLQVTHAMRQPDGQLPVQERRHLSESGGKTTNPIRAPSERKGEKIIVIGVNWWFGLGGGGLG